MDVEDFVVAADFGCLYEAQRDQIYNLNQIPFASECIKDAQQTMTATKAANKELEGMTKTVRIEDIDSMQDGMMDLMDVSNEIRDTLGRSAVLQMTSMRRNLWGQTLRFISVLELDALKADMDFESNSVSSYLKPDKETDLDSKPVLGMKKKKVVFLFHVNFVNNA
ncbi:Charged multivesicular body protein 5 [Triticum urartu]|uniref:Charged multivesicular body protein 5 n=1 Tax=Triticum urartu TaxID=4572 RepID=M7ZJT0_TRIUA|nr:Charged multivesicular body protein 5 [Triticum urartu]